MQELPRRTFLGSALSALAPTQIPIIDTHIHLFDQTRPQGAPYSAAPLNTQPALPARYRQLAAPLGITGAIEVEASPWIEDNLWVLQVQQPDNMMLGTIGNLQPEKPEFREYLDRYHKNPLFLGIRYGNLWGYELVTQSKNPLFLEGLNLLQQANLTLDTANPRPDLLEAILRLNDKLPNLRIVIDHLPRLFPQFETQIEPTLRELSKRPTIYVKVSELLRIVGKKPATDPALYRPTLDHLFETFTENKLLFGSDWPNAEAVNHLPEIVEIVKTYFTAKGPAAAEKYFWRNSIAAYRWTPRAPNQPR